MAPMPYKQPSLFEHAWKTYTDHFGIIVLMAVPGLLALLVPLFVGTPAYIALGGVYLRTGSIPDLTSMSAAVMLVSLLVSLFLMSLAWVNINLVIKSQRTMTNIGKEVMNSLTTTTLSVFWVFMVAVLLFFIIQLVTFEYGAQGAIAPVLNLLVGAGMLFMPTAMVMDDLRPWRALERSIQTLLTKAPLVVLWLLIALVTLTVLDGLALWILPHPFASWVVLFVNSLLVVPYLMVLLGQIYISKYTILQ